MIIYKITINNEFYIGSTNNLGRRKVQHKYCLTKINNPNYNLPIYKYIRDNGGIDNIEYSIIEENNITDLIEQKKCEQRIINEYKPTLNTHSAYQDIKNKVEYDKQYRLDNAEKIQKQLKQYYLDNAEKIKEQKKQYRLDNAEKINEKFKCDCGGKYTHRHKQTHLKTEKHKKYMENNI